MVGAAGLDHHGDLEQVARVIASEAKQSSFHRAQLAAHQPKLRASGLEGGASAQLKNGLLRRFAPRNDEVIRALTSP
jgi:hypothetical protein